MKIMVLGSGGREHALVRALSMSSGVKELTCLPGSDGISNEVICYPTSLEDHEKIIKTIQQQGVDLVVCGPEVPLANGLGDKIRALNIRFFGPSTEGAKFEASKEFCKNFLTRNQIPTAKATLVNSVSSTLEAAKNNKPPYVLKADGLAAGKGVIIAQTIEDLTSAARSFFEEKSLGDSGNSALLEEFMSGWELSQLIITNGSEYEPLALAQDHKRLLDKDKGPNTGGMGATAPFHVDETLHNQIKTKILKPIVQALKNEGIEYRGILYVGLMITPEGPKVVEFNVRFGDPEAQVILPLLDGDWASVFWQVAGGEIPKLKWKNHVHTACVVLAAEGYPEAPVKGTIINGDPTRQTASSYFLHAGTKKAGSGWMTNGGRVLNAIGIGTTHEEAIKQAYSLLNKVNWTGMQFRRDIK